MNELINQIKETANAIVCNAELQSEKGNKAAGLRARRASLDIEPMLKRFRKISLEAAKSAE